MGAIPDFGEGGYIGGREYRPFKQAVLQLRKAMRIGVLTNRRRLIVGFERLIDVIFLVGEIEDEGARFAERDAVEP